jgi:hypothetical protein
MLATWRTTFAKYSRVFTTIAKQAMPFGDPLSLKSESDFSSILSLNMLATWRLTIAKWLQAFLTIAKCRLAIWQPLIA